MHEWDEHRDVDGRLREGRSGTEQDGNDDDETERNRLYHHHSRRAMHVAYALTLYPDAQRQVSRKLT